METLTDLHIEDEGQPTRHEGIGDAICGHMFHGNLRNLNLYNLSDFIVEALSSICAMRAVGTVRGINRKSSMNTPVNNQKSQNNQTKPGDDAPPGTPGTGEDICPVCRGSGKAQNGGQCPNCNGTGKVTEGIGGG